MERLEVIRRKREMAARERAEEMEKLAEAKREQEKILKEMAEKKQ